MFGGLHAGLLELVEIMSNSNLGMFFVLSFSVVRVRCSKCLSQMDA